MAHLLQSLQDYFTLDEINIDNWTFKLFYKVHLSKKITNKNIRIIMTQNVGAHCAVCHLVSEILEEISRIIV